MVAGLRALSRYRQDFPRANRVTWYLKCKEFEPKQSPPPRYVISVWIHPCRVGSTTSDMFSVWKRPGAHDARSINIKQSLNNNCAYGRGNTLHTTRFKRVN